MAKYLPAYREFQYLSKEDILSHQTHYLCKIMKYAVSHSKYYKDKIGSNIPEKLEARELYSYLSTIPTTGKQDLIENDEAIKTNFSQFSSKKTTGGSTGEPVNLIKNPQALARERAATWRAYEWAGVSIGDIQARFWGTPHNQSDSVKAKIVDFIANRTRISAFNLSEESLFQYYQKLCDIQPAYLYGYVSVISTFAEFIDAHHLAPLESLRCVITTSEVLTIHSRRVIQEALKVPVFNEYGCGEVGSIAHECEYGNMHLMADNLIVETEPHGATGEIIVTDLFNYSMPLIRYRLGDFATLSDANCGCGRNLPLVTKIHGRAYDLIQTPEGNSIHPEAVMYIFEAIQKRSSAFKKFQAIQKTLTFFEIKVIPTDKWSSEMTETITSELKKHIHRDIEVNIKLVDTIQREKSGKMRVVKSEVLAKQ